MEKEVLVPAKALTHCDRVKIVDREWVTYVHIMFDRHQIVTVDGVESESFFPGAQALSDMDVETRQELIGLFPELSEPAAKPWSFARPVLSVQKAKTLSLHG